MPSLLENENIDAKRIQCENATSPSEKRIMCQEYEMAKQKETGRLALAEGGLAEDPAFAAEPEFLLDEGDLEIEEEMNEPSILDLAPEVLDEEDMDTLNDILDMHPELPRIIDVLSMAEGNMEGHVTGPGDETSDSIPAKLSDGEFVFTAKAVKQLGVDKLQKMMQKAEEDFDSTQTEAGTTEFACGGFVHRK